MKKIVLIFSLFITACSSTHHYDTEFKNPVFNQPLRPIPKDLGYVYLTPTYIDIKEPNNKNKTYRAGKCQLVENKEKFIKLLCRVRWQRNEEMLNFYKHILKTDNGQKMKETAKKYLQILSGDYYENEYYTYTIKEPFLDNCVNIEQNIYEIREEYIGKVSSTHFCTPPLNN